MEELLKGNEGLVHACIQYAEIGGIPYRDAVQEGLIGLWQAIKGYDSSRGVAFSTYAWRQIWGRVWNHALAFSQKGEALEEEPFEGDYAGMAEAAWQQEQIGAAMREMLEMLPERLRGILEKHYGLNDHPPMTMKAIGQQMGLTRERIRQLRNEALVLLRIPALSIRLRGLSGRDSRLDYRQARQLNDAWLRRQRRLR